MCRPRPSELNVDLGLFTCVYCLKKMQLSLCMFVNGTTLYKFRYIAVVVSHVFDSHFHDFSTRRVLL